MPQPSRIAKANASAVVATWVPPARSSRIGNDSATTRQTTSAQKTGGCCSMVASPPLARSASRHKPDRRDGEHVGVQP